MGTGLKAELVELVKKNIKENFDKFDHTRTNVQSLLEKKVLHYSGDSYLNQVVKTEDKCNAINIASSVFFNYDGGVYLCQPDIGNQELEIGNLNNDRFIDIWNSSKHKEVINTLDKRWSSGNCKNCRSIAYNKAIYDYKENQIDLNEIEVDCFL